VVVSSKSSQGEAPAEPATANPYAQSEPDSEGGSVDETA
jgi:hypothetical protein